MRRNGLTMAALALALAVLVPGSLAAQEEEPGEGGGGGCGDLCEECGQQTGHWFGVLSSCQYCHASYDTGYCAIGFCRSCNPLSRAEAASMQGIVEGLETARLDDLAGIVAEHGNRILVHPARRFAIVQGGCDGQAFQAIVFLPQGHVRELTRLSVRTVETYLAARSSTSTTAVALASR